ncbi:F-box associated domain containing protein, partial [Tanacetum coccineum]
ASGLMVWRFYPPRQVGLRTKEYKVIRIIQGNITAETTYPQVLVAEVYTFGRGKWRRLGHVPYWISGSHQGAFLNGCVHWVIRDRNTPEKLCSFNFDKETFQLFPSPPSEELAVYLYERSSASAVVGSNTDWDRARGKWRRLGHVPYWISGSHQGALLNGCVHWVVRDRNTPEKLCSFNFDKETFQLFPSPPSEELAGDIRYETLGILHGFLSLTDTSRYKFNIRVMKVYGIKKSWHKEVVITESMTPNINWATSDHVYLLEALEDGTILMSFEDKLFVYCPRKKIIEGGVFSKISLAGVSYRPSFVKLQSFESERVQVGLCSKGPDSPLVVREELMHD